MEYRSGQGPGLVRRILLSPSTTTWGIGGMTLASAWGCLAYFGRALTGAPGMSQEEMMVKSLLPVLILGLPFGVLAGRRWPKAVIAGVIPPLFLGLMFFWGSVEVGETAELKWARLPGAMILSILCLGTLGGLLGSLIIRRSEQRGSKGNEA